MSEAPGERGRDHAPGERGRSEAPGERGTAHRRRESARPRPRRCDEEPVLPGTSRDEQDVGWGDEPGERDDEWYRRERPPHHD